jgi:hypothetical protein
MEVACQRILLILSAFDVRSCARAGYSPLPRFFPRPCLPRKGNQHEQEEEVSTNEAREDTVLFPALHEIVSPSEYEALGKKFDEIEHKAFGGDGFDTYLEKVNGIEKQLGIYDLAQFMPR